MIYAHLQLGQDKGSERRVVTGINRESGIASEVASRGRNFTPSAPLLRSNRV